MSRAAQEPPMVHIAELADDPATIEASLFYLARGADKLVTYVAAPGGRDERSGGGSETHRVMIHNGRPLADGFVFEREGFRFVDHDTRVADFFEDAAVRRGYFPQLEGRVKKEGGAQRGGGVCPPPPTPPPDEALVFKVYESLNDGRARWTAHTAFVDPTSPPHARPRESIEIRTLAFF